MMPLSIAGPVLQLDILNSNKWGIPSAEADNIISGLQGVPLKICSGEAAIANSHACDYNWDPKSEIGAVRTALRVGDWIYALAEVTDSAAAQKIKDGTWKKKWSIFVTHKNSLSQGMLKSVKPRALTLVRDPAYPGAGFALSAGASDECSGERVTSERWTVGRLVGGKWAGAETPAETPVIGASKKSPWTVGQFVNSQWMA
ncbi:Uncharacterised protein [uncultured archaeon]|nr:Uncharacterised protein [uncultured archaeon]